MNVCRSRVIPAIFILTNLIGLLGGCAKEFQDVSYESFRLPSEGFKEVSNLGVIFDTEMPADLREDFIKTLNQCKPYKSVIPLADLLKFNNLKNADYKAYFEKFIKNQRKAQPANALLAIDVVAVKQDNNLEKSTAYRYYDRKEMQWYANYGIPSPIKLGFADDLELGPERKIAKKAMYIRNRVYTYQLKFVMYSRVQNELLFEDEVANTTLLSNYSRRPAIRKQKLEKVMTEGLAQQLAKRICTEQNQAEKLYYETRSRSQKENINQGVELAEQGRWKLAAQKWENVLLKDKDNAIANHNLGIHFERAGQPLKAAEYFRAAEKDLPAEIIKQPRWQRFLNEYRKRPSLPDLMPQIGFISAGNWVYIYPNGGDYKKNAIFSVYRVEPLLDQKFVSNGSKLREVGLIRVVEELNELWVGRVLQATVEYPVLPGDFLLD